MPDDTFDYSLKTFTQTLSSMSEISAIQHNALMEIATCELTLNGGLEIKRIAAQALVQCFKLAQKAEETIKQN